MYCESIVFCDNCFKKKYIFSCFVFSFDEVTVCAMFMLAFNPDLCVTSCRHSIPVRGAISRGTTRNLAKKYKCRSCAKKSTKQAVSKAGHLGHQVNCGRGDRNSP